MHLFFKRLVLELRREELPVQTGDVRNRNHLRTLGLASSRIGTVTEAQFVHLGHHRLGAAGTLDTSLRQFRERRHTGGDEKHRRAVLTGRSAGTATDAGSGIHRNVGIGLRDGNVVGILPKGLDGKSFLPVIKGKKTNKEYVFGIQTTRGIANGADYYGIRSVRNDKFSYILNLTPEVPFQNIITRKQDPVWFSWINEAENDIFAKQQIHKYQYRPKEELYDIINDPYQMHNLIDDVKYASEVKKLRRQLQRWMDSQGDKGQETEMRALEHKWNPKKH